MMISGSEELQPPYEDYFFIKSGMKGRLVRVNVHDILYVEAALNYVIIHLERDKQITYLTMIEILSVLNPLHFIRIHKSFIVNLRMIQAIEDSTVILRNKALVYIGAAFKENLDARLRPITVVSKRLNDSPTEEERY